MPPKKKSNPNPPQFEPLMEKLHSIASRLESEHIDLAEALQAFEDGIVLVRDAQSALSEAEQKVKLLLEKNGEPDTSIINDAESQE